MYTRVHMRVYTSAAQRSTSGVLSWGPHTLLFETGSVWAGAHHLNYVGWPVSPRDPPVSVSSELAGQVNTK